MSGLPSYRRVFLRVFSRPGEESARVAARLRAVLGAFGEVDVVEHGPYWKIPENLEFGVSLTPHGRVAPAVHAVRELAPRHWDDDVWVCEDGSEVFVHPDIEWVSLSGTEADPAGPPRFRDGDPVRIVSEDVRGVVYGDADPHGRNRQWRYSVFPLGQDTLTLADEGDLELVTGTGRQDRAIASLRGLAVGDALGSQFFVPANRAAFDARELPPGPWQWTDDTEMACSVLVVLELHGRVEQDALAASFAEHHDFDRGYGPSTNRMLRLVREGGDWRALAREAFGGQGSWGNGAAMRVAPLGAWFAGDLDAVVEQAVLSAEVTHPHPEAVAGAVAVAVAAALTPASPGAFLDAVLERVPAGTVRDGISEARKLLTISDPMIAASVLGNGRQVAAHDTVPFALWAAARTLGDYEAAFWTTAAAGGDVDTTCAIVGGILGAHGARVPAAWLDACERLPTWAGVR